MNRVALVTGAAGGIGSATVMAYSDAGWDVVAVDRRVTGTLPKRVEFVQADLATDAGVAESFARVGDRGRLDALVNNAAVQVARPALDLSTEDWDKTMASNLRACFLAARAAFPYLQKTHGCIVNVASVHALATSPGMAAYAASKGALTALTRALAIEFAPAGVRVNAVLPGAIETSMLQEGLKRTGGDRESNARAQLEARTPLGRIGRPEEVAQAILFLSTAETASFVTGQSLVVDGGAMARLSTE